MDSFKEYMAEKKKETGIDYGDFPYPFLLLLGGYTLILIIDKVIFDTHAVFGDHDHDDDHHEHGRQS